MNPPEYKREKEYPFTEIILTLETISHLLPLVSIGMVIAFFMVYITGIYPKSPNSVLSFPNGYVASYVTVILAGWLSLIYCGWMRKILKLKLDFEEHRKIRIQRPARLADRSLIGWQNEATKILRSYYEQCFRYVLLLVFIVTILIFRCIVDFSDSTRLPAEMLYELILLFIFGVLLVFLFELPAVIIAYYLKKIVPSPIDDNKMQL